MSVCEIVVNVIMFIFICFIYVVCIYVIMCIFVIYVKEILNYKLMVWVFY